MVTKEMYDDAVNKMIKKYYNIIFNRSTPIPTKAIQKEIENELINYLDLLKAFEKTDKSQKYADKLLDRAIDINILISYYYPILILNLEKREEFEECKLLKWKMSEFLFEIRKVIEPLNNNREQAQNDVTELITQMRQIIKNIK